MIMLGRVMASNRAFRLTFIPFVLLAIILLFAAACKGGASGANVTESLLAEAGNHPSQDAGGIAEEIAGLEAPTDVDPGLFDALKKAFAAKVKECERFTSSAPPGDFGRVTDLEYDPETGTLLWSYVNAGDCDLSGDVGVPDITPIAEHYCETVEYDEDGNPTGDPETPEGALNHLRAWIDCDHSGEVGISDITPIAENYLAEVAKYAIITSDDPEKGWMEVAVVYPPDPPFGAPPAFNVPIPTTTGAFIAVRPLDSDGKPGAVGNIVTLADFVPAHVESVSPTEGVAGRQTAFTASVVGTPPVAYEWHFGGGATPNTSADPSPTVTLGSMGTYDASLKVTNEYGDDTFDFTLTVTRPANENLVPVPQALPCAGDAPLTVTLFSNGSYNLTGEIVLFEWDFESDGVYDYSAAVPLNVEHEYEGGTWRATLKITDENGATAAARTSYIRVLAADSNWTFEKVLEDFDPTGTSDLWVVTLNINPVTDLPVVTHYYAFDREFGVIFKNEELEWETDIWYLTGGYGAEDISNAVIYEDSSIIQVLRTSGPSAGDLLWVLRRYPDGDWDWWTDILEYDFTTSKPRSMLALDPEGNIGLFYIGDTEVKYALFDGVNWNYEPTGIDREIYPWFSGFGFRGDIPWVVNAYKSLYVLDKHGDSWTQVVVGIPDPGDRFEYALCSSSGETRYICASELYSEKSWIWQNTGDLWLKEKLYDTDEKLIARPEAVASNENLVAVVLRIDTSPIQYVLAYKMSGDWQYELIRYDARLAIPNSMVVTDDNSIFLAYIDQNENELHVATRTPIEE